MAEKHQRYRATEKGKTAHREYMRAYMASYRRKLIAEGRLDREKQHQYDKEAHRRLRARVFETLGGARCNNCGCDVFELLEVNHIKGAGRQELKSKQSRQLYRDIINGQVEQRDYNVLCKVCNTLHYVEALMGVEGFQVKWNEE